MVAISHVLFDKAPNNSCTEHVTMENDKHNRLFLIQQQWPGK